MKNAMLSSEEKAIERNYEKYLHVSKETKKHIEKLIEGDRKRRPIKKVG